LTCSRPLPRAESARSRRPHAASRSPTPPRGVQIRRPAGDQPPPSPATRSPRDGDEELHPASSNEPPRPTTATKSCAWRWGGRAAAAGDGENELRPPRFAAGEGGARERHGPAPPERAAGREVAASGRAAAAARDGEDEPQPPEMGRMSCGRQDLPREREAREWELEGRGSLEGDERWKG